MISESKELELEKLFEFKIGTKNKEIIKVRIIIMNKERFKKLKIKCTSLKIYWKIIKT